MLISISGKDMSENVVDGKYSVTYDPVTDSSTEFTNIYGEKVSKVIGNKVTLSAELENVPQEDVDRISAVKNTIDNEKEADIQTALPISSAAWKSMSLSIQYNYTKNGINYWTVNITLTADCVPVSGL